MFIQPISHARQKEIMKDNFRKFSQKTLDIIGSPMAFVFALFLLIVWIISGTFFHFNAGWPLVINTITSISTFLMVFLIQNTQNRDAKALHLKLDELIRSVEGARNTMVNLEELSEEEIEQLQDQFKKLRSHYSEHSDQESKKVIDVHELEKLQEDHKK
jgi:low affinity Fe/Cu permease